MIELMRDLDYEPGEVLFHGGTIASHLYFVVDGRVELRSEGEEPWVFGEVSVLGIVDAMRERPYGRTAVAVRPTHVIAQAFTDYMDVLEDNFDLALQTLRLAVTQNEQLEEGLKEHLRKAGNAGSRAYGSALGSGDESTLARLLSLRATPTFAGSPVQALARLAHLAGVNRVAAGTRLFAAGERIDVIYVLTHGRVEEGSPGRE